MVELETPLLFVRGDEPIDHVLDESLLVGFEHFAGWLDGGMDAWESAGLPVSGAGLIDVSAATRLLADGASIIDVREPDEFASGHVEGAIHVPLGSLSQRLDEVPEDRPVIVVCAAGSRAASGVSVLERAGRKSLFDLQGGMAAWHDSGEPEVRD